MLAEYAVEMAVGVEPDHATDLCSAEIGFLQKACRFLNATALQVVVDGIAVVFLEDMGKMELV